MEHVDGHIVFNGAQDPDKKPGSCVGQEDYVYFLSFDNLCDLVDCERGSELVVGLGRCAVAQCPSGIV